MLNEANAWRKIARRIVEGEWENDGLCFEVEELRYACLISEEMSNQMIDRIDEFLTRYQAWAYPPGEEGEARALAALLFAVQVEEEYTQRRVVKTRC
jgi:hypothetical protein